MRTSLLVFMVYMLQCTGCSSSSSQTETTTPDSTTSEGVDDSTAPSGGDDRLQRALEAAGVFGDALGPILATVPDDRAFEACERANDLMNRSNALREVGVPEGVSDAQACQEELARLHSATTMMATYCGRGVDTVPPNFWVSAELTFYRLMLMLDPSLGGSPRESVHVASVQAVREVLEPMLQAHREDRISQLCQVVEPLVASVERLEGEGTPSNLPSSRHYTEEMTRLVTETRTSATQCGEGIEAVSSQASITIEVTAHRLWFMLHRRWPGSSAQ